MDEWIDDQFENSSLEDASAGYENSSEERVFNWKEQYNRGSLNWEESLDLKVSLQMLLQVATDCADIWKDVNAMFNDRRSFHTFLWLLQTSGLDWHKHLRDEDRFTLYYSSHGWSDQLPYPNLTSDLNWAMAIKYHDRCVSLVKLMERIRSESCNEYSREQAGLLRASFLDHLILKQAEQLAAAYGFSEHLEQLRKCDESFLFVFSTNAVDGYHGHDYYCPLALFNREYVSKQKHLIDSLCNMSCESIWLLRKLKASPSISPSLLEESEKILDIIVPYFATIKIAKRPFRFESHRALQSVQSLLEQGIGRKSFSQAGDSREYVTGMVLGWFRDALSKVFIPLDEPCAAWRNQSADISSLRDAYSNAAEETLELIDEVVQKLNSVLFSSLTGGGSPLGNIKYWIILFESCLFNHRLDFICKKHLETINLGVKLLASEENISIYPSVLLHVEAYLNRLHESIGLLLSAGERVLLEFVSICRTMAEITYMLGDAFTTGGAGMNNVSDETSIGSSNQNEEGIEIDINVDFPWDKHIVPDPEIPDPEKFDGNDPKVQLVFANTSFSDSDSESDTESS